MEIETLISVIGVLAVVVGSFIGVSLQIRSQDKNFRLQIQNQNKQLKQQNEQLKQSVNNQYDETLRKSMDDLYQVYRTDVNVKTKDGCELFATRILDILAVLAHLNVNKKIDDDILEFVKFDLEIARGIMVWWDDNGLGEKYNHTRKVGSAPAADIWSSLTAYFEKHDTKPCKNAALPDCIRNYDNLK